MPWKCILCQTTLNPSAHPVDPSIVLAPTGAFAPHKMFRKQTNVFSPITLCARGLRYTEGHIPDTPWHQCRASSRKPGFPSTGFSWLRRPFPFCLGALCCAWVWIPLRLLRRAKQCRYHAGTIFKDVVSSREDSVKERAGMQVNVFQCEPVIAH